MYKENLVRYFQQSTNSSKNILPDSLKEYLVQESIGDKTKKHVTEGETKISNCMFILLNVFYMMVAVLLIAVGTAGQFAYLFYELQYEFKLTFITCILSGVAFLAVSIYGIIGASTNSVAWINIYGILMIVAFVVQLNVVAIGFNLISQPESIAKNSLERLLYSSASYKPSADAMDFIQESLQCRGVELPSDWENNWKYSSQNNNAIYGLLLQGTSLKHRTPQSCCISGSSYRNLRCDHFQNGCLEKMFELILQCVMAMFYAHLIIASVQVVGIISSFVVAKKIRERKSCEGVYA